MAATAQRPVLTFLRLKKDNVRCDTISHHSMLSLPLHRGAAKVISTFAGVFSTKDANDF